MVIGEAITALLKTRDDANAIAVATNFSRMVKESLSIFLLSARAEPTADPVCRTL